MALDFYSYDKATDIHYIDYSGKIDMQSGLRRIALLEKLLLSEQNADKREKVLLDARFYIKHSPEVHDELSKLSRNTFGTQSAIKLAVVDANYECLLSDVEAWFTDYEKAVAWLIG